ncbi:MAG: hypothetical protein K2X82_07740, partial [Gemmataceae bacterium]|nr:hypothetical protein [Gemmataceae bacterium]
ARGPGFAPLAVALVAAVGLGGYAWVQVRRQDRARDEEQRARLEAEVAADRAAARRPPDLAAVGAGLGALLPVAETPDNPKPVRDRLAAELVGVWAGGGREVEYRADGTYRDGDLAGTWKAVGLTGTRVLTVERTGGGPARVRVTFEGDELLHDGPGVGTVTALRRK